MKNRESAARSRARKQEYTAQLEVQVAKLREENRLLLEKVSHYRFSGNLQDVAANSDTPKTCGFLTICSFQSS